MKRFTKLQLQSCFEQVAKDSGISEDVQNVLRELSLMVADMQAANIDISIDVLYWPTSMAFSLSSYDALSMEASGVFHVAGSQFVFGVMTKENGTDCLKILTAWHDQRFHGGKLKMPSLSFDMKSDAEDEGIQGLQKHLIQNYIRAQIVKKNDVADVFGKKYGSDNPTAQKIFRKGSL